MRACLHVCVKKGRFPCTRHAPFIYKLAGDNKAGATVSSEVCVRVCVCVRVRALHAHFFV